MSDINNAEHTSSPPPTAPLSRDDARAMIFNTRAESKHIKFNGVPVIIRQPSLGDVLNFQGLETDDTEGRKRAIAMMFVDYVYMHDGSTHLFEYSDVESLLTLPFNASLQNLQRTLTALMEVAPDEDDKSEAEA